MKTSKKYHSLSYQLGKHQSANRYLVYLYALKYLMILLLSATLFSCSSDDDNTNLEQDPLLGKWEVTSGVFIESQPKYLIFNTDNTISFLHETGLGFKANETVAYTVSGSEIKINVQGFFPFEFILEQNKLQIIDGANVLQLIKNNNAPSSENWVEELSILSKGNAPVSGEIDFAFSYDKTKIIYGMNDEATYIPLIDPVTFTEIGQIATTNIATAVEIEKFEDADRFLFQNNANSNEISVYKMDDGTYQFSLEVNNKISGMASVDPQYLWAASNEDEGSLNLINVADNTIDQTIPLGYYNVNGLDYQNGFLYIADGKYLHKCQTTPTFKTVATYEVSDFGIQGIAFDGFNFWVSGFDVMENSYKIIKTNLTP
ncbi:hypothetical protein [Arenibacter sp. S6351L]|uniref:YncE family protein n=1 Tax=Arenibacter sp. S6351L TaxID=2926407 RepID=UPI001FF3513B|nr:hypothetical protein [Arenibacter sp. S6351L]MCK0136569.1 hypothetical protein [Arenibacter sp. S6351L]